MIDVRRAADDIVHTVRDPGGAWALFADETGAELYAAKVHGVLGPDMTREAAERLVRGDAATSARPEATSGD